MDELPGFLGDENDVVPQPTRANTTNLDWVIVQPILAQFSALNQRMDRIESALERILERLQLPGLAEDVRVPTAASTTLQKAPTSGEELVHSSEPTGISTQQENVVPEIRPGKYTYTSLDTTKSEIRILSVQHASNFTDPIVAELKIVSLDDNTLSNPFQGYTALSYCWGPPVMDGSMILGGYHFPITKSLESALRHLRNSTNSFALFDPATGKAPVKQNWWIDQISINQDDIDERGSQVSLMRQIYKRASAVQVWLGDEADDSSKAMDILNTLGAPPQRAPGEKPMQYPTFSEAQVVDHWTALDAFFKRPWWERVWIRQEIALSFNVKMSCGHKTFDMSTLGPAVFVLNYIKGLGYETPVSDSQKNTEIANLSWDFHPKKLVELKDKTGGGYAWVDLSRLLFDVRGCKATDARDTVFSVIGLADPEVYAITPSYRQDLRDVLITAAGAALGQEYGLDLFGACQNPERSNGLPSWVPNLSDAWKIMPFNLMDKEGRRMGEHWMTDDHNPKLQVDGEILTLKGDLLDSVRVICEDHVSNDSSEEELEAVYTSWREFIEDGAYHNELEESEVYYYFEDNELAKERMWIRFLSVFWDDAEDLKGHSTNDYPMDKKRAKKRAATNVTPITFADPDWNTNPYHHVGLNFKLGRSYLLPPSYTACSLHPNSRIHKSLRRNCVGRRLCITDRGMVALIPAEARIGDPIAIFEGASFPYVLSKADDNGNHVLVGEAFIPRYTDRGATMLAEDDWNIDLNGTIRLC